MSLHLNTALTQGAVLFQCFVGTLMVKFWSSKFLFLTAVDIVSRALMQDTLMLPHLPALKLQNVYGKHRNISEKSNSDCIKFTFQTCICSNIYFCMVGLP